MPFQELKYIQRNTRSTELGYTSNAKFLNSGGAKGGGRETQHLNIPLSSRMNSVQASISVHFLI